VRQMQRALAEPVVIAVDRPAGELLLQMHGEPVGDRALADVLLEQEALVGVEVPQRRDRSAALALVRDAARGKRIG
ncbi:hypothetical protein, partial [Bradyrhizobium ottawaense]|uniref:hypothetical protein n=1 Tax=Bradyrhizobium ottawaense TaxID=931866 RepID=UPI0030C774B7